MAIATWTKENGWHDARITAFGPLELSPATSVFHYAQTIFEGMKAYRHPDGSIHMFRPEANAARFARSARRLALPELPEDAFLDSLRKLVEHRRRPGSPAAERPRCTCARSCSAPTRSSASARRAQVTYCVITSPAGSYFARGVKPVRIWLSEEYTRAAPGGTGAAKTAATTPRHCSPRPRPPSRAATRSPSSTRSRRGGSKSSAG